MDELVVCIDTWESEAARHGYPSMLHKGAIYTVIGVCECHPDEGLLLAEVGKASPMHCGGYHKKLFRPIRRPGISALQELARETTLRCVKAKI